MNSFFVVLIVLALVGINIALWKFGFVHDSEKPNLVDDRPMMDPRQRKAILRRIERWKTEGKLSPAEVEKILYLCENDWDAT